jgi:transcriptional regulator with GAF, ATPase, and Fis domain
LRSYHWPGNVRELENVVERAVIITRGEELDLREVLPLHKLQPVPERRDAGTQQAVRTKEELRELEKDTLLRALEQAKWKVAGEQGAARMLGVPPSTLSSRMKALRSQRPSQDSSQSS